MEGWAIFVAEDVEDCSGITDFLQARVPVAIVVEIEEAVDWEDVQAATATGRIVIDVFCDGELLHGVRANVVERRADWEGLNVLGVQSMLVFNLVVICDHVRIVGLFDHFLLKIFKDDRRHEVVDDVEHISVERLGYGLFVG